MGFYTNIQMKLKTRKNRSPKNFDLCECCGNPNCDPYWSMGNVGIGMRKIQKRLKDGKCMGCGKEKLKCSCKSK